jgi:MFS superfamily sulfate permease-like transporter
VLVESGTGHVKSVGVEEGGQLVPGLVVYRFASGLYYANSTRFNEEILALVDEADPGSPVRCVVLEASAIVDVDYSGGLTLKQVISELGDRGVRFVVADLAEAVRPEFDRSAITEEIGEDSYYDTVGAAVDAYQGTPPSQ